MGRRCLRVVRNDEYSNGKYLIKSNQIKTKTLYSMLNTAKSIAYSHECNNLAYTARSPEADPAPVLPKRITLFQVLELLLGRGSGPWLCSAYVCREFGLRGD